MRESNLIPGARRKFKITTNSNHNHTASPDLIKRKFKSLKPDQVWVSELTYIRTRSDGFIDV